MAETPITVWDSRDLPQRGALALAELYRTHAARTRRLAYLLCGNQALAEDIVQEAFVRLHGRLGGLRNPSSSEFYLRRTVINLARGHFRRLKVEQAFARRQRPAPNSAEVVEFDDELWNLVLALPSRQRAVIVLRYYEDLSEDQSADLLGCSVSAVKSLATRAMKRLRMEMSAQQREERDGA
jgi:RNA polymerase sigma-70 factor (sigma-E family)